MIFKLSSDEVEDVEKVEFVVEGEVDWNQRTTVLDFEAIFLIYVQAPGIYHSSHLEKHLQHVSVVECAIRFF